MSYHDEHSSSCQRVLLSRWKNEEINDSPISKDVYLTNAFSNWPSPDGAMYDPTNKYSIGFEFKPFTETRRGIQTGIGQSLTYLDKFSLSYLIIPTKLGDFQISNYLKDIFEKKIKGKVPIGLVSYNHESMDLKILVDIINLDLETKTEKGYGRYWAKFIDTNPHIVYLALKISATNNFDSQNRKEAVWKTFFDKYILPDKHRLTLDHIESVIDHWGIKKLEPFINKKKELRGLVKSGFFTRAEAIEELLEHTSNEGRPSLSSSTQGDNLYKSYRKNYFTFLDHLKLWDENANLTQLGNELYEIGKTYGYNSEKYFFKFAQIFLVQGKHYDLIQDIKKYSHGLEFDSITDAKKHVFSKFEDAGLIKRNIARAVEAGRTKLFSMQFQAWTKLGIISNKPSERYTSGFGFNFNEKRIEEILNS